MKLIVGLGNPGHKYENNRHNLGQIIVRRLAKELNCSFRKHIRLKSFIAQKDTVILALPFTFMNLSGKAVSLIKTKKKVAYSDIIVVCDDVHLDFGTLRIKSKGSSGGHKGLLSVIEELGTVEFSRLRVGIRPKKKIFNLERFVLSDFAKSDKLQLDGIISEAVECLKVWIRKGVNEAMNRFNQRRAGENEKI